MNEHFLHCFELFCHSFVWFDWNCVYSVSSHLLSAMCAVWDQTEVSCFSWICYDVTSYEHYADETTYENSLVYQGSTVQLSSLIHVMRSLTHNAREIFLLLVKHQLASQDSSTYIGMCYCPSSFQRRVVYVVLLYMWPPITKSVLTPNFNIFGNYLCLLVL